MVIQRLQSVFLLIAAALMGTFPWLPFCTGYVEGAAYPLTGLSHIALLVVALVAAVLFLLDIFLFNNFKLQKQTLLISLLLTFVTICLEFWGAIAATSAGMTVSYGVAFYLPFVALISGCLAYRYIRKDEKTLASYDRLR